MAANCTSGRHEISSDPDVSEFVTVFVIFRGRDIFCSVWGDFFLCGEVTISLYKNILTVMFDKKKWGEVILFDQNWREKLSLVTKRT